MPCHKRRVRKSCKICRTKKFICRKRKASPLRKRLVTDEICGSISQESNGESVEYWRTANTGRNLPFGTITVRNQSPHCTLTVKADTTGDGISDITLFTLTELNQTKSITLGAVASLEISSSSSAEIKSVGQYSITAHYFFTIKKRKHPKKKITVVKLRPQILSDIPRKDEICLVKEEMEQITCKS
ncbi:S-Ena type endospore appendage [Paenibacillus sp. GCM10012304]|uniref:S-Ena type endospore appendage n=1 Tax=Paenibacillus sp. GCM10012304 TaxID=3317341 RepID=UPI0036113D53